VPVRLPMSAVVSWRCPVLLGRQQAQSGATSCSSVFQIQLFHRPQSCPSPFVADGRPPNGRSCRVVRPVTDVPPRPSEGAGLRIDHRAVLGRPGRRTPWEVTCSVHRRGYALDGKPQASPPGGFHGRDESLPGTAPFRDCRAATSTLGRTPAFLSFAQ
jgi:hypothetical protein